MLTKVFPTGDGKGYGPVEYLCAVNPFGRGEREKAPQVISGNPALIKSQIDAVPFKHKYTSGVHSFAPEDKPTNEQIMEVIEATEELAFAGLPLSSRSILWVKHEHAGRTELHFLIPRQEVNTGKSFNAFPPGWQQKYDQLRDKFNYKFGWARPDDPERARHWQPGINAKIMQDAKRRKKPNPKAEVFSLTDDLTNMAIRGKLASRSEIVSELKKRGYGINRQGKDYLTIIDMDGKKTRLKGSLFEENFNGPDWIKAEIAKIDKPDSEKILIDQKLAEEADARLQEAIRRTAQYNSNRYSMKEEEDEQSTGKQPETKSEKDAGNLGSSYEGDSGKSAPFQESIDGERNESNALYSEYGLGKGAEIGSEPTQRENVQSDFRENPLPDTSASLVGRTVGTGSEMAESHRRAVKHIHEWSDKDSQDSVGAGTGDHRGESGKPGRHDEADHGQPERIARQGFQFGKLVQSFRSLQKNTQKLADSLSRFKRADNNETDIDLSLRPALEDMEKTADEAISGLRDVYETRLLQNLMPQCASYVLCDTRKLLIKGDEVVKWLQSANAQNLLQKLAKFEMPLSALNLADLSSQAEIARSNLVYAQETKLLTALAHEPAILRIPDLANLENATATAIQSLRNANEILHLENPSWMPLDLDVSLLEGLESACNKTGALLKEAYEFRLSQELALYRAPLKLPNLGVFTKKAGPLTGCLQSAHEAKILASVCKRERKREKILKQCYFHAEWAGSDLQRWDRVFAEYGKYSKHMNILNGLIEEAHSRFLGILAETRNMGEIEDRCAGNPFLKREFAMLKEILAEESGLGEAAPEEQKEQVEIEKITMVGPK